MACAWSCSPRSNRWSFVVGLVAGFAVCGAMSCGTAKAEDFRVETKVYVGENEEPSSETTTLFVGGDVYDFLKSPEQTAVYSRPRGKNPAKFILLDDAKEIRTEFPAGRLEQLIDHVQIWAGEQADPLLKFAANPTFKESFEPKTGQLVLASHEVTYDVATEKAEGHLKAAEEYQVFLDGYAKLNTLLTAGPPPNPRLKLNAALAAHQVIPTTVKLTRASEKEPLRAEHVFIWRLSQEDEQRIDKVHAALASYRKVDNKEFVRSTRPMVEAK